MSVMEFLARSREARLLHLSNPVRSLMPRPVAVMVERLTTSASVIGLSVSRFSKTNLRTAASRFLSLKMEGAESVLLVSAARRGEGKSAREQRASRQLNAFIFISSPELPRVYQPKFEWCKA